MKKNIELYKVDDSVIDYYRLNVRDNTYTPNDIIRKKLTRNILLSKRLDDDENGNAVYLYGQLIIIVNQKAKTIVEVSNYTQGVNRHWHKDLSRYNILNLALGIPKDVDKLTNVM
jgi:hypothetical protein